MFSLLVISLPLFLLSFTQCYGAPAEHDESRIVGGTEAADGEFPFVVAYIHYGVLQCTATIISENWVLIAAHCVAGYNIPAMEIHAGSNNASDDTGVRVGVRRCIVHEGFDDMALTNDVALLELEQPLTFGPKIQAVALPETSQQTSPGTIATVIGWGVTETFEKLTGEGVGRYFGLNTPSHYQDQLHIECTVHGRLKLTVFNDSKNEQTSSSSTVNKLRKADIPVWSDNDCKETYGSFQILRENNICAGSTGRGQCNGDSGGPLISNGQQIGIVSWSEKPCGTEDKPGVFAEVSYFVDWIKENMNTK